MTTNTKPITAPQLSKEIYADGISKKRDGSGHFIFRKGYFYRQGTVEQFADRIKKEAEQAGYNINIINSGDHWTSFKGDASLANSSHYWVEAKVTRQS